MGILACALAPAVKAARKSINTLEKGKWVCLLTPMSELQTRARLHQLPRHHRRKIHCRQLAVNGRNSHEKPRTCER